MYSSSDTDSYFDNAKYLRKKNYNESVAVLSEIVNNDTTDSETRKLAADTIASYIEISQHEQTIENLISAKGFKDCVVFLNSDNATVVVESDGLTQAQAAQILDTVASETKFPYDVIKIIEIGSVQK